MKNIGNRIDTTFDFRSDTPSGKDPDSHSPTLRRYHKLLWSKPLPSSVVFELSYTTPGIYLHHRSEKGEFWLSSDAVVPSFTRYYESQHIIEQIPKGDQDAFNTLGYTMGGMMIFPGNNIDSKITINCARGLHPRIKDRWDLTLECIRRHYLRESNYPLEDVLDRYGDFFDLFQEFRGYVDFFLLQDMVSDDYSEVKFFAPLDDFNTKSAIPSTVEAYKAYKQNAMEFIRARNRRIREAAV